MIVKRIFNTFCPPQRALQAVLLYKKPDKVTLNYSLCADERIRKYGEEDINHLPLAFYLLRWNIKAYYYKGKTFWSLEEYRIRSREGIERLINLLAVSYSEIILFSYIDANFSSY